MVVRKYFVKDGPLEGKYLSLDTEDCIEGLFRFNMPNGRRMVYKKGHGTRTEPDIVTYEGIDPYHYQTCKCRAEDGPLQGEYLALKGAVGDIFTFKVDGLALVYQMDETPDGWVARYLGIAPLGPSG